MEFQSSVKEMAQKIALECQGAADAHCVAACPMHAQVKDYIGLISHGHNEQALKKIRQTLFLPGCLGRICAAPCEKKCKREQAHGEPIAISTLERYLADAVDDERLWDLSKKAPTGKQVAVIGAGPAGAQAAIDLAKEGHSVTIYERLSLVGGMMSVGTPDYRLPREVIRFEYTYLEKLGIDLQCNTTVGKDLPFETLRNNVDAVIVANGAHQGFQPAMIGDDVRGLIHAIDFLKKASLDHKTELLCRQVVVVGGGDVAIDCARTARRLGASKVTVLSLEEQEVMPASRAEQQAAQEEGVAFLPGYGVQEIKSVNGQATGVFVKKCVRILDHRNRFSPSFEGKSSTVPCDTIIFATGQLVQDVTAGALEQTCGGRYVADPDTLATALENVFVAGDCAGSSIVVEAMALGRKAAISANRFLAGEDLVAGRNFESEYSCATKLNLPLSPETQELPRTPSNHLNPQQSRSSFAEYDQGFDDDLAQQEATRCLQCKCRNCMAECLMLNDFTTYPGELFATFLAEQTIDPLCVYSCNLCEQCRLVCPEGYPLAQLFARMRQDLVKQHNGKPPLTGHRATCLHQKLGFSRGFTLKAKGEKQ